MPHVTRTDLDAHLDFLLASPKDDVPIDLVCVRPTVSQRRCPDSIELSCREGVVGDRWQRSPWLRLENGDPDPRIQVAVANTRILKFISRTGQALTVPGDNIVADIDLSAANMPVGQRLRLGSAVIEVSSVYNDACSKFAARYGPEVVDWIRELAYRHLRLRGIFATVVTPGRVARGDTIRKC